MHQAAPDIFKVDDENGMVALYRKVEESYLAVGVGSVTIAAKLLGYAKKEEASEIPYFKEMVATLQQAEEAA